MSQFVSALELNAADNCLFNNVNPQSFTSIHFHSKLDYKIYTKCILAFEYHEHLWLAAAGNVRQVFKFEPEICHRGSENETN